MLEQPEVKIATEICFMMSRESIDATKKEYFRRAGKYPSWVQYYPVKGKYMKVISSQKKRNGLRTKPLPKKLKNCLPIRLTVM